MAEEELKSRQKHNPRLSFLSDVNHIHFTYYKWRTFSYAQGDSERAWRLEPFQISAGGPVFIPPPLPFFDKAKALEERNKEVSEEEESSKENEALEYFKVTGKNRSNKKTDDSEIMRLPYQLKRELLSILEDLTVKQTDICNAMIFVMENTEYYKPIINVLREHIFECNDYDKL